MVGRVHVWVIRQLTLGEFSTRQAVVHKATVMAVKIACFAYGLNILSHLVLVALGLLPYPLGQALVVATMVTPPVSFLVALIAYSVVGLAIYDLGLSRQRFEILSRTDMLSGLMNRRAFLDEFEQVSGEVALLLFDIDRFKAINDALGHKAGDDVIIKVADALTASLPEAGLVARIGGEEFAVLLSGPSAALALETAERMRGAVEGIVYDSPVGRTAVTVTVSVGVAEGASDLGFSEMFSQADQALYCAKAAGRNRIVHAHQRLDKVLELAKMEPGPDGQPEVRRSA